MLKNSLNILPFLLPIFAVSTANAQDNGADLAKQLSNPIASLISLPFQFNYDKGHGPNANGSKTFVNVQPVIPFSIGENWNVISRTIVPFIIEQNNVVPNTSQSGIGDIVQSLFISRKELTANGTTWGVGPVFLFPTATDKALGGGKWGAGLTGVVLRQSNGWTYGGLANHIWSFAGDSSRNDINATFVQPFLSYTTPDAWSYTVNTESTYDWNASDWSVPVNFTVGKVVKFGKQPVQLSGGIRYWADSATNGPSGFGARFQLTFMYPK